MVQQSGGYLELTPGRVDNDLAFNERVVFPNAKSMHMFMESISSAIAEVCDYEADKYLTLRKNEMDFSEKNIYAEGEAACKTIKRKVNLLFKD